MTSSINAHLNTPMVMHGNEVAINFMLLKRSFSLVCVSLSGLGHCDQEVARSNLRVGRVILLLALERSLEPQSLQGLSGPAFSKCMALKLQASAK